MVWSESVHGVRWLVMDESALLGLGIASDPQAQHRALQYFEQLKISDTGWQLCASALTSGTYQDNDHVKFFCFQVIEHYLKTRYAGGSVEEHQQVKSFLLTWLQLHSTDASKNRTFIRNKSAQMFALAFVSDYIARWPEYYTDLLKVIGNGESMVDMYLRILTAIDTEVVDRDITHTQDEIRRNTELKDLMRVRSVPDMVDSWYHIATTYETRQPELTCFCLQVIGAYISWIDINLIANDRFVTLLLHFLSKPLIRETACDCIHEIISKGMEPVAKTKLIESLASVLQNAGLLAVSQDEEGDYLAKLAKLINGIGIQLIAAWQKLTKSKDDGNAKVTLEALENKVPLMLKFLHNEDDDVSGAVAPFAHDYLTMIKQLTQMNGTQRHNVKELLVVVIDKMKYDDSYNFDHEGEDEAMFEEYRKELKVIINNVGTLDSDLLLSSTKDLLTRHLGQWQSVKFCDVEVAIALLYQLCEALPGTAGQLFSAESEKTTEMQHLMRLLVSSNVSCYQHVAVALQFFETVVRYDKFFNTEPQYIPNVLMAFLDERGLRNVSPHVRSRTSYLFSRFVKAVSKQHIQSYLEEILTRVHDLLLLNSPDNGIKHYLSGDDQLFMYETAGVLIVQSHFDPQKKQELMKQLLAPIVSKFDGLLERMTNEREENRQLAYAQCLSQAMAFASRASKGFSSQQTMKSCGCVEAYTETLTIFLRALDTPIHRQIIKENRFLKVLEDIMSFQKNALITILKETLIGRWRKKLMLSPGTILHQGVRQYLHRMVVCLEQEILPFIPVAMENLLKTPDPKEVYDFIPLINQVVNKFKKEIVPFLQEVFMSIVRTIFQVLNVPTDDRDQVVQTEKKLLQRGYFSFLATLVNNNVTEVLSNQEPQNLQQVLLTVIEGAVNLPDPTSQKTCFAVLKRLVEIWGTQDNNGLAGFLNFMYKNILPACFMAPMKPTFNLSDGQTVLALNECANCLKSMLEVRGEELIEYLEKDYLPSMNVAPEIAQEFCVAIKSDHKVFRNYFKSFFLRAKS